MFKRFLWAAALALASCSSIAETSVGMHIGSQHIDAEQKFNDFNPGAYVNHNGWTAGAYFNSIKKWSFYGGYTFEHRVGRASAALTIGGITGYAYGPVAPLIAPSVSYRITNDWAVRGFYLPKVKFTGAHVVHLALERKF